MMDDTVGIDCVFCKPCYTCRRDLICLAKLCKDVALNQSLRERYADGACQVIITCASKSDRPCAFRLT
jgi:hypothetical protein